MKNILKLMFLLMFVDQYTMSVEWYDFCEENGNMVYQLCYFAKLFKKHEKNEELALNVTNHTTTGHLIEKNQKHRVFMKFLDKNPLLSTKIIMILWGVLFMVTEIAVMIT